MKPGTFDMEGSIGVTFTKRVTLYNVDDETGERTPIDITGYGAKMQVRVAPEHDEILIDLDETDGITLGDDAGTVEITITAELMAEMDARDYVYDLLLTHDDVVDKYLFGRFRVNATVTRDE